MIYVFKTSVDTQEQADQLGLHINERFPNSQWNFDLNDCDKILRIDSVDNIVVDTISLFKHHNFSCEELE